MKKELSFIIRLDDACPTMNLKKWEKIEKLLDKYNIKPIVGIIPENKDKEFNHKEINNFWNIATSWQKKGWIIAQHGLHHNLSKKIRTEYKGKSYEEQKLSIKKGLRILKKNGINPQCFFAPAHTFDKNTIRVCKEIEDFKFISDGYSFYPFRKFGMLLIPSVFDTPHKISNSGVFTFIYHPNNMTDYDYKYLETFIKKYRNQFNININDIISKYKDRKRTIMDYFLFVLISFYRMGRNICIIIKR